MMGIPAGYENLTRYLCKQYTLEPLLDRDDIQQEICLILILVHKKYANHPDRDKIARKAAKNRIIDLFKAAINDLNRQFFDSDMPVLVENASDNIFESDWDEFLKYVMKRLSKDLRGHTRIIFSELTNPKKGRTEYQKVSYSFLSRVFNLPFIETNQIIREIQEHIVRMFLERPAFFDFLSIGMREKMEKIASDILDQRECFRKAFYLSTSERCKNCEDRLECRRRALERSRSGAKFSRKWGSVRQEIVRLLSDPKSVDRSFDDIAAEVRKNVLSKTSAATVKTYYYKYREEYTLPKRSKK